MRKKTLLSSIVALFTYIVKCMHYIPLVLLPNPVERWLVPICLNAPWRKDLQVVFNSAWPNVISYDFFAWHFDRCKLVMINAANIMSLFVFNV